VRPRGAEGGSSRVGLSTPAHCSFDGGQQEPEIQPYQIDIGHREHDLAPEDDTLVEHVTQNFGQLDPLYAKYVVGAHSDFSPTKW